MNVFKSIKYIGEKSEFLKFAESMIIAFDKKHKEGKMLDVQMFVLGTVHGKERLEIVFAKMLPGESLSRTGVRIGIFKPSILLEPISHEEFKEIRRIALEKIEKSPELRIGQALYIVLYRNFPELAQSISGTEFDPFEVSDINDERLKKFYYRIVRKPWEE